MCVDIIRTAYTREVSFFKNRPDIKVRVRWYRCKDTAKNFPAYTRFASGDWAYEKADWPGVGEVLDSKRVWNNGATPATANGQNFCGTLQEFAEGLEYPPGGPPVLYDANGIPTCCQGAGPPVPPFPPPGVGMDFNWWKQVSTVDLQCWYPAGDSRGTLQNNVTGGYPGLMSVQPYFSPRGGTLDGMGIWLDTNGSPGTHCRMAMYEAISLTDIRPGPLLFDSGDVLIDSGAPRFLSVACNIVLDPLKLHWLAFQTDDSVNVCRFAGLDYDATFSVFGQIVSPIDNQALTVGNCFILPYGPFPDPCPSILGASHFQDVPFPSVVVRYSA